MTDPLTLEMKMRRKLAEAEGKVAEGKPDEIDVGRDLKHDNINENTYNTYITKAENYWYARGTQDTIELLLPDVISMRKVREWLKDWALSMPIDDLEAFTGATK
jgi:hypothetical protein